jgi:hypothetical protein
MKMLKNKRGITLIALVITIIVLLILAGITINLTIGEDGIITKAKEAGDKYAQSAENEQADLAELMNQTENIINSTVGSNNSTNENNWDGKVNAPELLTGMTAIKFSNPVEATASKTDLNSIVVTTNTSDTTWYNYEAKQWANAQTEDGSMWVWIPRFAYKVNSATQTFDIVFLIGTTDNYYNADGTLGKAQRATSNNTSPDTTADYTVHPAFTNESSINYANGGWDSELTGIWVAKFEAGLPDSSTAQTTTIDTTDWYYPVFQGQKYSYNWISTSNAFLLSQAIAKANNLYGLSSTSTDSHLMKNSEWGAVAYLSQSQYGLNGTEIAINNVAFNGIESTVRTGYKVYAVTGYSGTSANDKSNVLAQNTALNDAVKNSDASRTSYAWYTTNGIKASSTGTIYGIYDMSGGITEQTSTFVNNTYVKTNTKGTAVYAQRNTKYVMVYEAGETGEETGDTDTEKWEKAARKNYIANNKIGDAIKETVTSSCDGTNSESWYSDYSYFSGYDAQFIGRGGPYYDTTSAGLFAFTRSDGGNWGNDGFRTVLVKK